MLSSLAMFPLLRVTAHGFLEFHEAVLKQWNPLTLGTRGHLPSRPIVSSLWVLKQFAPTLPGGSMLGTF